MRFAPVVALALAALFATGCSGPAEDEAEPLDADTYVLTVANAPSAPVPANTSFSFDLSVDGTQEHGSDHIGAHYGNTTTATPSTTVYTTTCAHQGGTLPGDFQVTCTAPVKPGVYFLRGHARIIVDNVTTQWWSAEHAFTVV